MVEIAILFDPKIRHEELELIKIVISDKAGDHHAADEPAKDDHSHGKSKWLRLLIHSF